jgi:hypothetical protein
MSGDAHYWTFMTNTDNQNQDQYQTYMDQQIEDSYYDHIFFSSTYRVHEQTELAVFSGQDKNQAYPTTQEELIREKYIQKMIDQDDYNDPTRIETLRLLALAQEENQASDDDSL